VVVTETSSLSTVKKEINKGLLLLLLLLFLLLLLLPDEVGRLEAYGAVQKELMVTS